MSDDLTRMSLKELRKRAPARLTIKQALEILGISRMTLHRWREDGLVPGVIKIGRSVRIERDTLLDWIESGECGQTT